MKGVMIIQDKFMWCFSYRSQIGCHLTIIFADIFKRIEFKRSYGQRPKMYHSHFTFNLRVFNFYIVTGYNAIIVAAHTLQ